MSEIPHKSLEEEILYVLGRSSAPLTSGAIYERCDLADEMAQVSKAIFQLQSDGKIERFAGPGRQRYKLADGVAAPAPAGKAGRPAAEPAAADMRTKGREEAAHRRAAPLTGIRPAPESGPPVLDIPKAGDSLNATDDATLRAGAPAAAQRARSAAPVKEKAKVLAPLDAGRLADAIIAANREQLRQQAPRWSIDQSGAVAIHSGPTSIDLNPLQARVLAEMVLVMHDVLEQHA